jgi:ABC-type multidrug transport system permease subunit
MSAQLTFAQRLRAVTVPTTGQALAALVLSLIFVIAAQSRSLLLQLGLPTSALDGAQAQLQDRFNALLSSSVASQIALVTFWAVIGLLAYLICWGIYNAFIAARNKVTLTASYTNRGQWQGPYEILALKAVSAVGLALVIGSLWFGVSLWLALSGQVTSHPSPFTVVTALFAVLGFAMQLYLVLVFAQLTFTPWYRAQTFTNS